MNVDGNVGFDCRSRAKEGAERRSLIVGRAATVVSIAFLSEHEWLGVPGFGLFRGGLNVDVVINRDSRKVWVVFKQAVNDGIALIGAVNLNFSSESFECFDGEFASLF